MPDADYLLKKLEKVRDVLREVTDIHPLFRVLYPVAVLAGSELFIFRVSGDRWYLHKRARSPEWLPRDVLAAFPLEQNDFQCTCVIHEEALDSLEGIALVLHEFVHCHQFNEWEPHLRGRLRIAREYEGRGVYDWELTHPFPYNDEAFAKAYEDFLQSFERGYRAVAEARSALRRFLSDIDYEYMTWVEWKEGFARYIENLVRRRLGLKENHLGREKPFSRITFYEGGAELIALLVKRDPGLLTNLGRLYEIIYGMGSR